MSKRFQSIVIQKTVKFYWICLDCGQKNFVDNDEYDGVRCEECTQRFNVTEENGKIPEVEDFYQDEDQDEKDETEDDL